jgi:hypothetical protein
MEKFGIKVGIYNTKHIIQYLISRKLTHAKTTTKKTPPDGCFKCQECNLPLAKGKEVSKKGDGRTLCPNCYQKLFGPKGVGFGGAMGTGGT